MKKVLIECEALIDKYELNKEVIIKQLQAAKLEEGIDFVIAYQDSPWYDLVGDFNSKTGVVRLTNIIKAEKVVKSDNRALLEEAEKLMKLSELNNEG